MSHSTNSVLLTLQSISFPAKHHARYVSMQYFFMYFTLFYILFFLRNKIQIYLSFCTGKSERTSFIGYERDPGATGCQVGFHLNHKPQLQYFLYNNWHTGPAPRILTAWQYCATGLNTPSQIKSNDGHPNLQTKNRSCKNKLHVCASL